MIYIGIDPGVRMCGVAVESHGQTRMRQAFLVRSKLDSATSRGAELAAGIGERVPPYGSVVSMCVEGQQFYGTERSKGDPNQLIELGVVAGYLAGALSASFVGRGQRAGSEMPLPRQWKGTIKKDVHHDRLKRDYPHWIEPVESETPKSMQHHVWDAVGLLEWHKERAGA